ncbi:MAG: archaellin/type IV pilin N-terminal domain-containing protein [Nanobdellota archaeon]
MRKKAEMGIGTLIIFIAMILVAAIAAGVLIQTASSLQNKALLTGERSQQQVSTSLKPMLIYAENGSGSNHAVDTFYTKVKVAPGSDPVALGDLLVEMSLENASYDYGYNSTLNCDTNLPSGAEDFASEYLIKGSRFESGYLHSGDIVKLCFKTGRNITEDETLELRMVPKVGNPTLIETAMPDYITQKRVVVFP